MLTYQYPSKQIEVTFCRGHPLIRECQEGHGFDPERKNLPLSSLEVDQSSLGERAGRGVFARIDIPQQSYVGLEKLIPIIYGGPQTYDLMANWETYNMTIYEYYKGEHLEVYTHGYGHVFSYHVSVLGWFVHSPRFQTNSTCVLTHFFCMFFSHNTMGDNPMICQGGNEVFVDSTVRHANEWEPQYRAMLC
jgi:hypothetical protein